MTHDNDLARLTVRRAIEDFNRLVEVLDPDSELRIECGPTHGLSWCAPGSTRCPRSETAKLTLCGDLFWRA